MGYKSIYYYESAIPTDEVIKILYKDDNHYQLSFKRNILKEDKLKDPNEKEELIDEYIKKKKIEIENNEKKKFIK